MERGTYTVLVTHPEDPGIHDSPGVDNEELERKNSLGEELVKDAVASGRVKEVVSRGSGKRFSYVINGVINHLTIKQLAFVELYFYYSYNPLHGGSASVDSVIEAGYDSYHKDKDGKSTSNINYQLARSICTENLSKPAVRTYYSNLTSTLKLTDQSADRALSSLIEQEEDKKVKLGALKHYNEMNNRIKKDQAEQEALRGSVEAINKLAETMAQIIGKHSV